MDLRAGRIIDLMRLSGVALAVEFTKKARAGRRCRLRFPSKPLPRFRKLDHFPGTKLDM
eukprot:COSAG03_NODE_9853_length_690_cov_0.609137_1_plen_58_part_10